MALCQLGRRILCIYILQREEEIILKKTKNLRKRVFSLFLALVMCAGLLQTPAFAAEEHEHNSVGWTCEKTPICTQEEHTHDEACEAKRELRCGQDEHTHEGACYDDVDELICAAEEHAHSDECYAETEPCGREVHEHSDDCYDWSCTKAEQCPNGQHRLDSRVVQAATCTENGLKENYCTLCGYVDSTDIIYANHKWSETVLQESTCFEMGKGERTCSVCGTLQTVSYGLRPHTWGEWTVTKEAIAGEKGEKIRSCTVCGEEEIREFELILEEGVFVIQKDDIYTYRIYGKGVFAGEFYLDGERKTLHDLGYAAVKKLILEEGITAIADGTFTDSFISRSMTEIVLPATLTSIGARAFYGGALEKINLDYVISVGTEAFAQNGLTGSSNASGITELTIPAGMTEISDGAFYGMSALEKITLSEGVTSIAKEQFMLCSSLETVVLPESLETIGEKAFSNCIALKTIGGEEGVVRIDGVKSIGAFAFESCSALRTLRITNVGSIGESAFYALRGLTDVSLENVESVNTLAFFACTRLSNVSMYNIGSIGQQAFQQAFNQNARLSMDRVKTIGQYAFYSANMSTVEMDHVQTIGQLAFCGANMSDVKMGEVDTIAVYAFQECFNLTSIDSLANVGRIDGFAFYSCPKLTGLTVEDVTKMGFNGNYADVMERVEAILSGRFKLDSVPGIAELVPDVGWTDSRTARSDNWNTYENGTQIVEQARWINAVDGTAEVKVDAYYTGEKQMDYVFVADLSASMAQLGNVKDQNSRFYDMQSKLLDMTRQLLGAEGYDCRVAIVTFGGDWSDTSPGTSKTMEFTSNAAEVEAHIKSLTPLYENTDYGLGMRAAKAVIENNGGGRNMAVIFLSDGAPNRGSSGDSDGSKNAADIRELGVPIFGVLHSPGAAHDKALEKMQVVCGENTVYESTDTESFGRAMNEAFAAVYPEYTLTIPVGSSFGNAAGIEVSESAGEAVLSEDGRTITWTITGMPFTKHTLTYGMTANAYGTLPVNGGNAVMKTGDAEINRVESPALTRIQPVGAHTLTVRYQYSNGVQAAAAVVQTVAEGASYSVTSPAISGFRASAAVVSGTMGTEDLLFTVTYTAVGGGGGGGGTGGGGGGGTTGGTTINDAEVPLAGDLQLNKTDHFAYIKGYQDGTVRPNNPLTRAQVATIFYRLLDEMSRTIYFQETNDFTDVKDDFWACKAISTLTNAGIITGFQDGTFRPNAYITRAQFAAIAARFDNVVPGLENPFSDVAEDYWARDLIAYAASKGWINGSNGKFRPLENITRLEAMDFINNVLDRHVDEKGILDGITTFTDVPVTDPNYYVVEEATNSHDYTRRTEGQLMENWTKLNPDPVWDE